MISYKNKLPNSWLNIFCWAMLFVFITLAQADTDNTTAAFVLFSHGNLVLTNASSSYPLEKDGEIAAGDTVITGNDGRVQLRFSDGTSSLQRFEFTATEAPGGSCSSCKLYTVGFLSGEKGSQAGVVYNYKDNENRNHTGAAALDQTSYVP